jgi:hypothetical protein
MKWQIKEQHSIGGIKWQKSIGCFVVLFLQEQQYHPGNDAC